MTIEVLEVGQKCELNNRAMYSASWNDRRTGKPTGSGLKNHEHQARAVAEEMLAKGRTGVCIKKRWVAGFAIC